MDSDQSQFFNSVKTAFGNQETDEEKQKRLQQEALERLKQKNLQNSLTDFFQSKLDRS